MIELVIVVVIIGLVAAIAIPRFSKAGQNAAEAALRADLRRFREAIDLYETEHGGYWPALQSPGGGVDPRTPEAFERHLTWYTAENGEASRTPDAGHYLGPYLQKLPPLPVGRSAGNHRVISLNTFSNPGYVGAGYGWEYEHHTGRIRASCRVEEVGSNGVPYYEW